MKAIILAAGQGTRLKKYTENLPKGMLEFAGKTIIQRQIETYRKCGILKIIVVKGYAADKIHYDDIHYYINENYAQTNMVESLMAAREEFDEDIIISYSDILFSEEMLRKMMCSSEKYAVAVDDKWKEYWQARYGKIDFDTESLRIDSHGDILELGLENPHLEQIDARYVGLLKFSVDGMKRAAEILERDYPLFADKPWKQSGKPICKAYMTDLLQALIEDGQKIKAERFEHGWIEFDTNEDYETACRWAEEGTLDRFIKIES